MSDTDLELLARYTRHHTEEAFAEIVRRHLDLVFSAALRQVRSAQLAEEVAQTTFISLARDADRLAPDTILAAWLYQVAHRTAANVVRRESRRQLREQIATEMHAMNATTAADWTHVEPLLDEAMHALDDTDRAAVLLRYFENKSLREVGVALGASENAAQKRLTRAVERLREFFGRRGVTAGAGALVILISANAVQAAPAALLTGISATALQSSSMVGVASAQTWLILMKLNAKVIALLLLAALLGGSIGWYWFTDRTPQASTSVSSRTLQASLERAMDAGRSGDMERVRQSTGWVVGADVPPAAQEEMRGVLTDHFVRIVSRASRLRVINQLEESTGTLLTRVERTAASGVVTPAELRFVREAGEWKPAFSVSRSPSGGYGGAFLLPPTPALGSTNQTTSPR